MTTATWEEFETALHTCDNPVSRKEVANAFDWMAARNSGRWSNGAAMDAKAQAEYMDMPTPFDY